VKYWVIEGHSSYITSFDWSLCGAYIRSTCGAYELLYWNVSSKSKIGKKDIMKPVEFGEHSCKLGWAVQGVYPPGTDGTHVNSIASCKPLSLLATGDDYGLVSIYRDPALTLKHQPRSYRGHSEHVSKVAFAD
jgi:WD40 repeat protein